MTKTKHRKRTVAPEADMERVLLQLFKILEANHITPSEAPPVLTMASIMAAKFAFETEPARFKKWQRVAVKVTSEAQL